MTEPYGHRGHPTTGELYQAAHVRNQIGLLLAGLSDQGFTVDEGLAFLSATAFEISISRDERWSSLAAARNTVEGVFLGHAAKFWSMRVISDAITTIKELS